MPSPINIQHASVFMLCLFHCIYLLILCVSSWAVWLTGCWNKSIYLSIYLYITILILFITSTFCPVFCILIQERCYSLGGYLVEIMSAEEHDVLLPLWQSACKLSDVFTWNNFLKQHISIILFSYSYALYRLIFQVASIHQPYPCNVFYLHF